MAIITAITVQVKDKKRCNVYLDGSFYCGLQTETILKNNIKVGQTVDEALISKLQFESEKSKALDKAFGFIEKTFKTEKQIKDYLLKKGYVEEVITYVLAKLKDYSFTDDEEYAKRYTKHAQSKKGKRLIESELYSKGVKKADIDNALKEYETDEEALLKLANKHIKDKERDIKNLQKTYKYLLSKGFSYEEATWAIDKLRGQDEENFDC